MHTPGALVFTKMEEYRPFAETNTTLDNSEVHRNIRYDPNIGINGIDKAVFVTLCNAIT